MKVQEWAQEIMGEWVPDDERASEEETKWETSGPEPEYNGGESWLDEHRVVKAHVIGD